MSLENALKAEDWAELKAAAHKLKSNVGVMGLNDCMPILKIIEDNAMQKVNLDSMPALVTEVIQQCNEAIELLKMEIKKLSKE